MTERKHISSFTVIVAFVCLAIVGIALIPLLPVKLAPSRNLPRITVNFNMPQNSARVVEIEATSRLESMLARTNGVKNINSTSGNGWGRITIELDKHTPIDVARFEVSTIIRQTWPELPSEVTYPYITVNRPDDDAARPFMTYTVNSAATPVVIQRYTENVIKTALSDIKGLYRIDVTGASPMEWQIEYDLMQLESAGVKVEEIIQAVSQYYSTNFLGVAESKTEGNTPSWIRVMLASSDEGVFDPAVIYVSSKDGALIRLDQLVRVYHREREPMGYYRINGLNSIYLNLTAEESANQLRLNKEVKEKMMEVESALPPGYEIHASYDATDYIKEELNKIYIRSGLTVLILTLFVLLITRSLKYLFLIVASLAVDLAIAVIFYYLFDLEMQLYSLAGITISLSLIIDNAIIMTDHMMHKGNRNAFMPIMTATITTIGALAMVFLLDERIRLNLQDFAAVVMINLMVSLFVALLFVPALIEQIGLTRPIRKKRKRRHWKYLRFMNLSREQMIIRLTSLYERFILLLLRRKWIPLVCIILLFGLPVFMIPDKIEKETDFAEFYNKIFDSSTYKEKFKPVVTKTFGGTLRLFVEKVYQGSYFTRNEEVVLTITASMPNGTTLSQMNDLVIKMERYLSEFPEIRQFQTSIPNPRRASINVFFKKEAERSGFPYQLKSNVISRALVLGGGSWGVYGLQDQGFSNDVREMAGQYRVKMYGYNYDELSAIGDTLKNRLLEYRRIREVIIGSDFSWYKDDYREFSFDLNQEMLASKGILPGELYASLQPVFTRNIWIASVVTEGENENIMMSAKQAREYDMWALQYMGRGIGDRLYRLDEVADIALGQMPQEVAKENQQYRLVLQYDYIGSHTQGQRVLDNELEEYNKVLPMGYTAEKEDNQWGWSNRDNKQYWLLGLLIVIIFFTASILFNSLKQPLIVIFIIPVSFIGIFLTFYWFKLNFDQGGFASFILLAGITINASIYILNEFNLIRKRFPNLSPIRTYLKAWNTKIIPIFLTIISTVLGFIPFLVGTQKEGFWFPLAAGTIGGLIMAFMGIFIFLPLLMVKRKE